MRLLQIKLTDKLHEEVKKIAELEGYSNVSEFIRREFIRLRKSKVQKNEN